MKKKLVSVLLVSAMAATMLAGCGGNGGSSDSNDSTQAGDKTAATGSVYLLNFKPETDEAWQNLAQTYTDQNGLVVNKSIALITVCHTDNLVAVLECKGLIC